MAEILRSSNHSAEIVEISNPKKRNAITVEMYDELERTFKQVHADPEIRAVVLTGTGQAFAGGTDISHLTTIKNGHDGVEYEAHMARVQSHLLRLRVPVISLVRGPCVGGGLALAALSDMVLCTPNARFGSPIVHTVGNTVSATTYARLQHTVGPRTAAEMLMTGAIIGADEARRQGFVNHIYEEEHIDKELNAILQSIETGAPNTVWSIKEIQRRSDRHLMDIDTDDVFERVYGSQDFQQGIEAFLSKNQPRFTGK